MVRIVALCAGLTACFSRPRPECGFVCGASGQCPSGYSCNSADTTCHLDGSRADMICYQDAAYQDAPLDAFVFLDATAFFHVVHADPADGSIGNVNGIQVTMEFDQPVDINTLTDVTFAVAGSHGDISGIRTIDTDNVTVARFTPEYPFYTSNDTISVQLTQGLRSTAGLPLAPYSLAFQIENDEQPPQVFITDPHDGAVDVPATTVVYLFFSERVYGVTSTTLVVHQGATPITGAIVSDDNETRWFTPDMPLPPASLITVNLTTGITDIAGNPFAPYQFTFTTQ